MAGVSSLVPVLVGVGVAGLVAWGVLAALRHGGEAAGAGEHDEPDQPGAPDAPEGSAPPPSPRAPLRLARLDARDWSEAGDALRQIAAGVGTLLRLLRRG